MLTKYDISHVLQSLYATRTVPSMQGLVLPVRFPELATHGGSVRTSPPPCACDEEHETADFFAPPAEANTEKIFLVSVDPQSGHVSGSWAEEKTKRSNFFPHRLHLNSKIGMAPSSRTGTTAAGSAVQFGHGAKYARSYGYAAGFSDQFEGKRVHGDLQAIDLVVFVAFSGLIQSQSHAGTASTIAAEKDTNRLILGKLVSEIVAGIIIDSDHSALLV